MTLGQALLAADFDPRDRPFFAKVHEHLRRRWAQEKPRSGVVDECVEELLAGRQLTDAMAEEAFREVITGDLADDQIGALLVLLRPDVLPSSTIAAFARVMRDLADKVQPKLQAGEALGDTCGTGSDTLGTFNISTTIMFILAAGGIKIAKHGNRAITSRCGSADVLQALDVKIDLEVPQVEECIEEVGIGFMFAPLFHRAFRNVQGIRRTLAKEMPVEIQAATVFNVLGPLANPAGANRQLIGVYSPDLVPKIADVLRLLGLTRALVVFGECEGSAAAGLDEFSTAGKSVVAELRDGQIKRWEISPEEVGLPRVSDSAAFRGGLPNENAEILRRILAGQEEGPRMDLALLNAGAGLYLGGKAASVPEGIEQAREIVRTGRASRKLEEFRAKTRSFVV